MTGLTGAEGPIQTKEYANDRQEPYYCMRMGNLLSADWCHPEEINTTETRQAQSENVAATKNKPVFLVHF